MNGSQRVVEKLKACFDRHGDGNLEEDNDMMAVAGLLKLFLRELPESCIPERLTRQFVTIQEGIIVLNSKLSFLPGLCGILCSGKYS